MGMRLCRTLQANVKDLHFYYEMRSFWECLSKEIITESDLYLKRITLADVFRIDGGRVE